MSNRFSTTQRMSSGLVLLLSFVVPVTQAYAQGATVERAVKEMQYALSTQWNQKDAKKQKEIFKAFTHELEAIQATGKSNTEIVKEMKMLALTKQQEKDLDTVSAYIIQNKLSKKDANALIVKVMESSAKEGASWEPGKGPSIGLIVGVVLGALVLTLIITSIIHCDRHPDECKGSGDGSGDGSWDSNWNDSWDDDWDGGGENCYEDEYGDLWCYS